jgi:DNA polymerase-3 subunit alpha
MQEANALQGGLFDFGDSHASSTQEPQLAHADPFTLRERLVLEKGALGFILSGSLFDEHAEEVRRFVRRPIAELGDAREPQLVAGIVGELRFVNGQRGRAAIFQLDDGTGSIEAVVNEEALEGTRELLAEDQLLIVHGKVQADRFAGGNLRLNASQAWDLPAARARFGRYLAVQVNGGLPPVADVIRTWPVRRSTSDHGELEQGLAVRLRLQRHGARAEVDLGEEGRFWPTDEALARWRQVAHGGEAAIVYESKA